MQCGGSEQKGKPTAPIIVARKPLEGTVAANVLAHGTGALNIDGCRVGRSNIWMMEHYFLRLNIVAL